MTMSSSLTAGWLAGIAFDVGFQRCLINRDASADVGCFGGGDLPAATTEPTEPLGCAIAGGKVDFGCSCSRPYSDFGGVDVGGLGCSTCFGGSDVGCGAGDGVDDDDDAFDVTLCCASVTKNGTSAFSAHSFAVNN